MTIMRDLALAKMTLLFAPPAKPLPEGNASDVEKKKTDAERIAELTERVIVLKN